MVIGPLSIALGKYMLNEVIYVAPISDDILLGVDLLRKHHAEINILKSTLSLQGQNISMTSEGETDTSVSVVTVQKTVNIPPRSVMRVRCNVYPPLKQFLIEPAVDLIGLLPRSLHEIVPMVDVYAINPIRTISFTGSKMKS